MDNCGVFSNLLDQFDRLVVPGTRHFNGHRIKHMGPGQLVVFGSPCCWLQTGLSVWLLATCASARVWHSDVLSQRLGHGP